MLVEQDVAGVVLDEPDDIRWRILRLHDQNIAENRLGDACLSLGSAQAMRGEGVHEIRCPREFVVRWIVVVRTADDADSVGMRKIGQCGEVRNNRLGTVHIEPAVGSHEIDLGVDIPEHSCHPTASSRGLGLYVRPTLAQGLPSVITISAVKSKSP